MHRFFWCQRPSKDQDADTTQWPSHGLVGEDQNPTSKPETSSSESGWAAKNLSKLAARHSCLSVKKQSLKNSPLDGCLLCERTVKLRAWLIVILFGYSLIGILYSIENPLEG
jgi:hypothetical protein